MTGWFACDEGDETEVPNERYPWQPVLQIEGMQVRLGIWFETKDACLRFITDDVIGKSMHPLARFDFAEASQVTQGHQCRSEP